MLVRAVLAFAFCLVSAAAVQTSNGFLGRPLTEVARTEFFTSFKLTEIRRRMQGEFAQVLFQPPAPAADAVRVMIRTTGEGEIRIIDAAIDRAFFDGTANTMPRDFVRALLRDGVPSGDDASIAAFVKELGGPVPASPSAAYQVFAGTRPDFTAVGKRNRVRLANVGTGNTQVFRVSIHFAATPD